MRRPAGFTLIEIPVVLPILALLLTFGIRGFQGWIQQGEVAGTTARMTHLEMLLEQHKNRQGDYPSSRLSDYGIKVRNRVNEGAEALVLALAHKDYDGQAVDEKYWLDLEQDEPDVNVTKFANRILPEVVDGWENPIAYWRYDDYGREQEYEFRDALTQEYALATVTAERNQLTGNYHANESYQLRSAGPATERAFPVVGHLDKLAANLAQDFARLVGDAASAR